ncbi:carbamoyltransferase [Mitsuaria sp. WAJ17]|uniref:carbamoyltransferase family protein n=1 Tax=Mitsuaria sp. WAJ17 TaxID=2761452 RepID=UPI00160333CC|nr:carbamoyltransferase C-terminal domain-containing protein [Mitsuaria sp. WAJ17]MBB2487666.1 carbamoyltransferase [Mitsuaria sp. WAJ17]
MITLGLNACFHDPAAALMHDGQLIAAAEEERFTRVKHGKRPLPFTAWELPWHAVDYCLAAAGITLAEVDHVAYSFNPRLFIGARARDGSLRLPLEPSAEDRGPWESPWDPLFASYVSCAPRLLVDAVPHHLRSRFAGVRHDQAPYEWHFVAHHLCHQASAFLASPFERCAVMTLDGRGERATTTYGRYHDERYSALGEVLLPHSLGLLYESVTAHLGFLHSSDEYKVMALAALGTPRYAGLLREHLRTGEQGQYELMPMDMERAFGPARQSGSRLDERQLDLAASLQDLLEETVLQLARWLREASGERHLAMAGGVALNCVMNARLRDSGLFDGVWVQPAAGDAGTALGAALWVDARERQQEDGADSSLDRLAGTRATASAPIYPLAPRRWQMEHVYYGPSFEDQEIEALLQWARLDYECMDDVAGRTAELLAAHRIVGWFQGRMEFGPRALGARSILASPVDPAMQARLNELKDREDFRPVAPAVPLEAFGDWFEPGPLDELGAPFMLFVHRLRPGRRAQIPSACHTDQTARVQTVSAGSHPLFHALLKAFGRRSGVPVLINTSFNVRGQPMVCTPRQALEAFVSTPLDALVIGRFLVVKPELKALSPAPVAPIREPGV